MMFHGLSHHSTGSISDATDYFLDSEYFDKETQAWKPRDPAPEILEGDPLVAKAISDSLPFKHRYTSGVLSFTAAETARIEATPGMREAIIEDLRAFVYAGFRDEDCKPLELVKQEHLGRLELHYAVNRVHSGSGLYFNPFPPKYDDTPKGSDNLFITQNNLFVDYMCEKYGLQNPRDPAIAQTIKIGSFDNNRALKKEIHAAVEQGIERGSIADRNDIIKLLEGAGGEIVRCGEDYISVKFEGMDKGLRLRGLYYGSGSVKEIARKLEDARESQEAGRYDIESRYHTMLAERAEKVEERHGKRAAEAEAARSLDSGAELELRATINEIKENLDVGSLDDDGARADAADFVRSNPGLMDAVCFSGSSSSGALSGGGGGGGDESVSDAGVGSTGNKVLDELIRKYHNWRKAQAKKESSGAAIATGAPPGSPAIVAYASAATRLCALHISTYSGFNFIEPNRGRLTLDDMRLYRQALRDELKAAKEDLRVLLAKAKAAEVRQERVINPMAIAEKVNSENIGQDFSFKSEKLKEILDREQKERESKKKRSDPGLDR